jgi:hypothetical protein
MKDEAPEYKQNWEKGWLDEVLNQADQVVQSWPDWMREPELRYPLNRRNREKTVEEKATQDEMAPIVYNRSVCLSNTKPGRKSMNSKVEEKVKEIIKKVEERAFESGRSDVASSDLIRAFVEEFYALEERLMVLSLFNHEHRPVKL